MTDIKIRLWGIWYFIEDFIKYPDIWKWNMCKHRSHKLHLPCLRALTADSFCGYHNVVCWDDNDCEFILRLRDEVHL